MTAALRPAPTWHTQTGGVVICPNCGGPIRLMLGAAVSVAVRANPAAVHNRKAPPSDPRFIAAYHEWCGTALEVWVMAVEAA